VSLRRGDGVLVTNKHVATHTFTVDALGVDSGSMAQGDTFRYVFRAPGRYTFYCRPHESLGMTGTLTVTP
jgi:plastocyanin